MGLVAYQLINKRLIKIKYAFQRIKSLRRSPCQKTYGRYVESMTSKIDELLNYLFDILDQSRYRCYQVNKCLNSRRALCNYLVVDWKLSRSNQASSFWGKPVQMSKRLYSSIPIALSGLSNKWRKIFYRISIAKTIAQKELSTQDFSGKVRSVKMAKSEHGIWKNGSHRPAYLVIEWEVGHYWATISTKKTVWDIRGKSSGDSPGQEWKKLPGKSIIFGF